MQVVNMKSHINISFITTVYNEENTILDFLNSLLLQTELPNEIIIVDGGSTDSTREKISDLKGKLKHYQGKFLFLVKKGNRSVGRNEAIKLAKGEIIVSSDVGCVLDKNFIKKITGPFKNKRIDVVSGFYYPITTTVFEKCLAAYTCVMEDKVQPENFLPSSRSIAFRKSAWVNVGGYPEELDTCEDLVFDRKLKKAGYSFYFCKDAFVYWPQRHTLKEALFQFYSYAKGDGEALYIRPQTPLLFLRYTLGLILFAIFIVSKSYILLITLVLSLILYILWAVNKNHRYVKNWRALYLLPLLQFSADIAVLFGFGRGIIERKKLHHF